MNKIFLRQDETYICNDCLTLLGFDKHGWNNKTCEIWEENSFGWTKDICCSRCYNNIPVVKIKNEEN